MFSRKLDIITFIILGFKCISFNLLQFTNLFKSLRKYQASSSVCMHTWKYSKTNNPSLIKQLNKIEPIWEWMNLYKVMLVCCLFKIKFVTLFCEFMLPTANITRVYINFWSLLINLSILMFIESVIRCYSQNV